LQRKEAGVLFRYSTESIDGLFAVWGRRRTTQAKGKESKREYDDKKFGSLFLRKEEMELTKRGISYDSGFVAEAKCVLGGGSGGVTGTVVSSCKCFDSRRKGTPRLNR